MNEQEKSLELAKMMKWDICKLLDTTYVRSNSREGWQPLSPYSSCVNGRAQFAAVLLRFPEVFASPRSKLVLGIPSYFNIVPTQAHILDEILRISGVNPDG